MSELNANFWNEKYDLNNTPWDIGHPSPPLINYVKKEVAKTEKILLPGAGKAYEAEWLHKNGYTNVFVCDWAEQSFSFLKERYPAFPAEQLLLADFFELEGTYDLILEQTFFSAIDPGLREAYAQKVQQLLKPGGKLVGVLFAANFPFQGPPFGGNKAEYQQLFSNYLDLITLEMASDSIKPRLGNEIFMTFEKR
ncbi:MAG: methyltransferase domain-containing protein [Bacteroidota bacterium]